MRQPLIREVIFSNLGKSIKKTAEVSVRIFKEADDLIYVSKDKSRRTVIGYTNPDTGLFETDLKVVDKSEAHEPYKLFRDYATKIAQKAIDEELTRLATLKDEDDEAYSNQYKPLNKIEAELNQYITDKQGFYTDIQKQVDIIVSKQLPHVNEWLVYSDDEISHPVTDLVPYKNPKNQTLTDEQATLVDDFLDVFLDEYNKNVLSWYMGATLLNLPLQDDRVSKALIVSSSTGGSGKSTLINAIANGVVTNPYRVIDSGFDKHFRANDKFSTSDLPTCRLGVYSEAYFNSETGPNVSHNFEGLDESEMKSWITEGYVANEKKFADKQIAKLTGMQIIITNHPPQIDALREDLSRRFMALIVKPSNMIRDKSNELDIHSEHDLYKFVADNAQAFANYFVTTFNANPRQYMTSKYNTEETMTEIVDGQSEYLKEQSVNNDELTNHGALVIISTLCKNNKMTEKAFIETLVRERKEPTDPAIRWDNDYLYISSAKAFYVKHNIYQLRELLKETIGSPIKKYNQRMFKLAIKD